MKTVFDESTVNELTGRISALSPASGAIWGKMNVYQMLKHCTMNEEMFLGKKEYKRLFIGRLFGKMTLNGMLKDSSPIKQNQPTHPALKITGTGDVEQEKNKWIALLQDYKSYRTPQLMHPFFGLMTRAQVGECAYKHIDHHLRQFGK